MAKIRVYFSISQKGNVSNTIHSTLDVDNDLKNALIQDQQNNGGAYLSELIERYCFADIQPVIIPGVPFKVVHAKISG